MLVGTPVNIAPELLDSWKRDHSSAKEASSAADIDSMGAILFGLLAGRLPVKGYNFHEVLDKMGML